MMVTNTLAYSTNVKLAPKCFTALAYDKAVEIRTYIREP